MRRSSKPFPIGDNDFTPFHLPQDQLAAMRTEVRNALKSALTECNKLQTSRVNTRMASWLLWRVQAQFEGLSAYARVHDLAPTTSSSRVFGTVQGNYMDIARFFRSETREQYFNVQKRLFPDTVDAAVLHTVPQLSGPPSLYEGIKWAAYTPSWRRRPIDTCVFESTGMGLDSHGRPYFYCVVIPTLGLDSAIPSVSKHTKHFHCRSVMIISPSANDDNASDVFMAIRSDLEDNRTSRAFYKGLLSGLRNVGAIAANPDAPSFALRNGKWVLPNLHRACNVCSRDFSVLRSKRKCSLCTELVCRKCLLRGEPLRSPGRDNVNKKAQPIEVCKPCIQRLCENGSSGSHPLSGEFTPCASMTPTPINDNRSDRLASKESILGWLTKPALNEAADEMREAEGLSSYPSQSCVSALSPQSDCSRWSLSINDMDTQRLVEHKKVDQDEEEDFFASGKSVLFTVDTSEMARASLLESLNYWAQSPCSMSDSIRSSLREQNKLLRQLQEAATESFSARRNS